MVVLDLQNGRMKDFFDIWSLAHTQSLKGETLVASVHDTFERRKTMTPAGLPTALTSAFVQHPEKSLQ